MPPKRRSEGKLTWTREMKIALYLLNTDYALTFTKQSVIFEQVFAKHLQECGVSGSISARLSAQWGERKKPARSDWHEICQVDVSPEELVLRDGLKDRFLQAARILAEPLPRVSMLPAATAIITPSCKPADSITPRKRGQSSSTILVSSSARTKRARIEAPAQAEHPRLRTYTQALQDLNPLSPENPRSRPRAPSCVDGGSREGELEHNSTVNTVTPLSRRAPVAFWAPESTPSPSKDDTDAPSRVRRQHLATPARALVPLIPREKPSHNLEALLVPVTPPKTPKRKRTLVGEKLQFIQTHGTVINVSPARMAQMKQDPVPVQADQAHPPLSGLLFRFWIPSGPDSHNSENGFMARKFKYVNLVSPPQDPPPCNVLDWSDIFYHIDRKGIGIGFQSPYISLSNCLIWTLRLALKEVRKPGNSQGRLSIIDSEMLDKRGLYHVKPYHDQLKYTFQFTEGSQYYSGTHEWLAWKQIPKKAIIHSFKVSDLVKLTGQSDPLRRLLRLDTILHRGALKGTIMTKLANDGISLTADIARAMAKLAYLLGLKVAATIDQLSHFVSEVVQGWGLNLEHKSHEEWLKLAGAFADGLFTCCIQQRTLRDDTKIKRAFLGGVAFGSPARHFNIRHSQEKMRLMYRRARQIGLEDPGKMVMDDLAAAQFTIMAYEKQQQRVLPGHRTQLLLEADEGFASADDEDDDDVIQVAPAPMVRNRAARQMMLEDKISSEDDAYEFGEDGRIR